MKSNRYPVIRLPLSPKEIVLEITAALGIVFSIAIIIWAWPLLPDSIPTHFTHFGQPDGWGGKITLFLLPALSIFLIYLPFLLLSRYPHIYNYFWPITEDNAESQYHLARSLLDWMKVEIVWLFAWINWQTIQIAMGRAKGMGTIFIPIALLVIFGTISIHMYKARPYND